MYLPINVPTIVNALFRPVAKLVIPAVAANATRAMTRRYSTRPWPASSWCRRFREFRIMVLIIVFSS